MILANVGRGKSVAGRLHNVVGTAAFVFTIGSSVAISLTKHGVALVISHITKPLTRIIDATIEVARQ